VRVELDDSTQVVRLDDEGFETLVAAAASGETEEYAAVLAAEGVTPAMAAVSASLVQVRLDVAGQEVIQSHRAWLDLETAAFLLAVHDEERQLLVTAPRYAAAGLARLVRLGPRKVGPRDAVPIETDVLEDLFHADWMRRRSALILAGADLAWTLVAVWEGGERLMTVVDGKSGAYLVEMRDEGWVLAPVDATFLWRRLTTVLPTDLELT
jgi:hypothetical protein